VVVVQLAMHETMLWQSDEPTHAVNCEQQDWFVHWMHCESVALTGQFVPPLLLPLLPPPSLSTE
jgi:hypothetical protein